MRDATAPASTLNCPPLDTNVDVDVPDDSVPNAKNVVPPDALPTSVVETSDPPDTNRLPSTTVVLDATPLVKTFSCPPLDTTVETAVPPDDTVSAPAKENPPKEPPSSVVDTAVP